MKLKADCNEGFPHPASIQRTVAASLLRKPGPTMFAVNIVAFLLTATVLTMAPGLDTAMLLQSATTNGPRHGVATAGGIALGCLCWGTAAALGLTALLHAWPLAFEILKWGGAAYLGWLGAHLLIRPRRAGGNGEDATSPTVSLRWSVRRGYVTNILNPKVGLFYLTLLPQFVPPGAAGESYALFLAFTHVAIALIWFGLLAILAGGIRPWLRLPGVMPVLDRITGGVFVALGLQLGLIANVHA